jgi:hypothetical protein
MHLSYIRKHYLVHFLENALVQLLQAKSHFSGKSDVMLRSVKFIAIPVPDKSEEEMKTAF